MRPKTPQPAFSTEALPPGTRLGLAVSGGGDSVALLCLAHRLAADHGWALGVLHVEHGLRGEAGREDAAFVRALATRLSLPCLQTEAETAALARSEKLGLEEAGRLLRYRWFGGLLASGQYDAIATGHTLDDQAETVLAKLLRGAWTRGLGAIHPVVDAAGLPGAPGAGPGRVVRPLLGARRAELRAWLRAQGQPWREDETNSDLAFTRNHIRHELVPVLEGFQPRLSEQLAQLSLLAREDEQYWQAETARLLPGLLLPGRPVRGGGRASSTLPGEQSYAMEVERLRALPPALGRRLVRAAAARLGAALPFAETDRAFRLLSGSVGTVPRREQLTGEVRVERTPRELRFIRTAQAAAISSSAEVTIPVPGEGAALGVRLRLEYAPGVADDAVQPPALLRAARPGDRVRLRHSSGAPKRVKEILERMEVAAPDRPGWPVLEWQGEIVWMRGAVLEPMPHSSELVILHEDAET